MNWEEDLGVGMDFPSDMPCMCDCVDCHTHILDIFCPWWVGAIVVPVEPDHFFLAEPDPIVVCIGCGERLVESGRYCWAVSGRP